MASSCRLVPSIFDLLICRSCRMAKAPEISGEGLLHTLVMNANFRDKQSREFARRRWRSHKYMKNIDMFQCIQSQYSKILKLKIKNMLHQVYIGPGANVLSQFRQERPVDSWTPPLVTSSPLPRVICATALERSKRKPLRAGPRARTRGQHVGARHRTGAPSTPANHRDARHRSAQPSRRRGGLGLDHHLGFS